ncbi:thiol:disulfide interchange protein DsbA/DsbL [Flagellatimonas centrodinii]|uniref:thiol:disulfide interchange protein DsbA/DsbL n=1 Tax=Flagellatimonas centrodinii TaxID=2806210 RepID=UPI001FEFA7D1|nr:thiol:disulfide interchange protein DsbA/DsbL [Flagellatimonas centrodinii]ULQ45153.1 thiol:disulfide interchange protein DsbA/DsbL [Flagellatimonas centrodinii]
MTLRIPAALTAVLLSLFTFACSAQGGSGSAFVEGKHYKEVREVAEPSDNKRIAVEEFFWYGCSHCYNFENTLEPWADRLPADVDFVRVPNSLGRPIGLLHSKAYYTADTLKLIDSVHPKLFEAMHVRRLPLATEAQIVGVFEANAPIMPDVVENTLKGFAVDARVRRAEALSRSYGVSSTPTLVVGGKYYTNPTLAGGFDEMVAVADVLIEKVRQERAKP